MKKLMSLLVAFGLLVGLSPASFAGDDDRKASDEKKMKKKKKKKEA